MCDEAIKAKNKNKIRSREDVTHILFVIRLPQQEVNSQFVGFQGDPWISMHIDDLRPTSAVTVVPEQALNISISQLFIGNNNVYSGLGEQVVQPKTNSEKVNDELSEASRNIYSHISSGVNTSVEESYQRNTENDKPRQFIISEPAYRNTVHSSEAQKATKVGVQGSQTIVLENMEVQEQIIETEENKCSVSEDMDITLPLVPENPVQLTPSLGEPMLHSISPEEVIKMPTLDSCEVDDIESATHVRHATTSFYPQHHRLLGCVQAAVSLLKDSQRDRARHRIHILINLIPKPRKQLTGEKKV